MATSGSIDFLNELSETESAIALQSAYSQKSIFIFKLAEYPNALQTKIESFVDKRAELGFELSELKLNLDQDVSIKFNVGTEVYFVKTKLKKHLTRLYFDRSAKVQQLKRRREARYTIPKKWTQSSSILNNVKALNLVECQVQDISLNGIRFEVSDSNMIFKRDDIIKIQFQIYKRAEIATDAIVKFFLRRPGQTSLLGMEFYNLKDVQQERIRHIVDDIINFQSLQKF